MAMRPRTVCGWLLALSGVIALQHDAATQGRTRPAYQADPWWPRPFQDQSWVLGSITGVTVDAQNHLWVVHRGGDSLENNEKGMMLTPPSATPLLSRRAVRPRTRSEGRARLELGRTGHGLRLAAVAGQPHR